MHPIVIFVITFFAILITVGLFLFIYILGKKSIFNNPTKATIIVKNGNEGKAYKGEQIGFTTKKARIYRYDKNKKIIVPNMYKPLYIKNKVVVFVNNSGQLISSPFDTVDKISQSERENIIYEVIESSIGCDAINALEGRKIVPNILLIIVAFILGVGVTFGFNFMLDQQKKQNIQETNITETSETNNNNGVIIEKNE